MMHVLYIGGETSDPDTRSRPITGSLPRGGQRGAGLEETDTVPKQLPSSRGMPAMGDYGQSLSFQRQRLGKQVHASMSAAPAPVENAGNAASRPLPLPRRTHPRRHRPDPPAPTIGSGTGARSDRSRPEAGSGSDHCHAGSGLEESGGDERIRTADLLSAIQALSQLSYVPTPTTRHYTGPRRPRQPTPVGTPDLPSDRSAALLSGPIAPRPCPGPRRDSGSPLTPGAPGARPSSGPPERRPGSSRRSSGPCSPASPPPPGSGRRPGRCYPASAARWPNWQRP